MPKVRRSSYNLAFKLKVVAEAEAVARDYGISESMVRRWRKDQRLKSMINNDLHVPTFRDLGNLCLLIIARLIVE